MSVIDLGGVSEEELVKELVRRRGGEWMLGSQLHGAIGALHDHLDRNGSMDSDAKHTPYLVFRLRREACLAELATPADERQRAAAVWQERIDAL